jgi:integrase
MSASRVSQALLCLKQILDLAVLDGRLARNVVKPVKPPRPRRSEPRFLTHAQVAQLAEECGRHGDQYRVFVLVAAYCGLRWGEMRALRLKRLDLLRGRIQVAEAIPDHTTEPDTPKSHKSRTVPIPKLVANEIATLTAGLGPDDLVFTNSAGGLLDNTNFRRNVFEPSVRALGLEHFTPHDLRHSAASFAISAGGNVKVVQRMLGHASAAVTLDIYAGLFSDDLDALAVRLDEAARADRLRTNGAEIVPLRGATGR